MIQSIFPVACSPGCFERSRLHALSHLVGLGRHSITGLLRTQNQLSQDWSADYRLYSRQRIDHTKVFSSICTEVQKLLTPQEPLIVGMDDSLLKKCGRKIHGSKYFRDPQSPPFHKNLIRGLRVLQLSAALPDGEGGARMVPIGFEHAPVPPKPSKKATEEELQAYEKLRARKSLSLLGKNQIKQLRQSMDEKGQSRHLIVGIDNRFTNSILLKNPPPNTTLIGRIRKDTVLFHKPDRRKKLGRKPKYGERAPTPGELLKDPSVPFEKVSIRCRGQIHELEVKRMTDVVLRMDGGVHKVQVVVIKPTKYRLRKGSAYLYKQPAFLVCTDMHLGLQELIEAYIWRWGIEVNFRDEKTILGVGEAQVRTEESNQLAPSLAVASYSILQIASERIYGKGCKNLKRHVPKWYPKKEFRRPSTQDLINQLRQEMWAPSLRPQHFSDFWTRPAAGEKSKKCEPLLASALFCMTR